MIWSGMIRICEAFLICCFPPLFSLAHMARFWSFIGSIGLHCDWKRTQAAPTMNSPTVSGGSPAKVPTKASLHCPSTNSFRCRGSRFSRAALALDFSCGVQMNTGTAVLIIVRNTWAEQSVVLWILMLCYAMLPVQRGAAVHFSNVARLHLSIDTHAWHDFSTHGTQSKRPTLMGQQMLTSYLQ